MSRSHFSWHILQKTFLLNAVSFSSSSSFLETRVYVEGQNGEKSPFSKMTGWVWTGPYDQYSITRSPYFTFKKIALNNLFATVEVQN